MVEEEGGNNETTPLSTTQELEGVALPHATTTAGAAGESSASRKVEQPA